MQTEHALETAPQTAPTAPSAAPAAPLLGANVVLSLQRTAGNRRTTAILARQARPAAMNRHLEFMRERTALASTLSPEAMQVELLTLRRMNEALRRDHRLAGREEPIVLHSRLSREVLAEVGRDPAALGPVEAPVPSAAEFADRMRPFEQLAAQLRAYRTRTERLIFQPWEQQVWLVRENQAVQDVFDLIADRLMDSALAHVRDARRELPMVALHRIASDPEVQALFRMAQLVPLDSEAFSTQPDVSGWAIAGRLLWGFVPIVGDFTDAAEAIAGWDTIEQRALTPAERGLMLLGALLPLVPGGVLRRGGEGAWEAARRLAPASRHSAPEIERALRAAEALRGEEARVRAAVERLRRGERLGERDAQRWRDVVRRVETAAGPAAHGDAAGAAAVTRGRDAAGGGSGGARGGDVAGGGGGRGHDPAGGARGRDAAGGHGHDDGGGGGRGHDGGGGGGGRGRPRPHAEVHAQALGVLSGLRHSQPMTVRPIGDLVRQLRAGAEGSNAAILRHVEAAWDGLQDPALLAQVTADIYAEAHRVLPVDYTAAVVRLSERTGAPVVTIPRNVPGQPGGSLDGGAFFDLYAGTGQRFLDRNVGDFEHGASSHLIQDLVVDRAFQRAGVSLRAEQFRALLRNARGTGDGPPLGDRLWRALWDSESGGTLNRPEDFMPRLRQILEGLE